MYAGFWLSFFLIGSNMPAVGWPACGEFDIMEPVASGGLIGYNSAMHDTSYNGNNPEWKTWVQPSTISASTFCGAYHTYWCRNEPNLMTVGVDGATIATIGPTGSGAQYITQSGTYPLNKTLVPIFDFTPYSG